MIEAEIRNVPLQIMGVQPILGTMYVFMMTQIARMLEMDLKRFKKGLGKRYDPKLSANEKENMLEELEKRVDVAGLKALSADGCSTGKGRTNELLRLFFPTVDLGTLYVPRTAPMNSSECRCES